MDRLKLTREELFQLVWGKPIQQLAKSFGISDVGLAKICKRMEIPRPTRGYWAKVAAGKVLPKPTLPSLTREGIDQIEITPTATRWKPEPTNEVLTVVVTDTLLEPHHLVSRTLSALKQGKPDERGMVVPRRHNILDVRVHRDTIERACRIMDALIKALATLNYPVSIQEGKRTTTFVLVNGETLTFSLNEKFTRSEHVLTPHEKARYGQLSHSAPRYDYRPTGILSFCLRNAAYGSQSRWADTQHRKLEERLGTFIQGLEIAAGRVKAWREENERRRIEYEAEEKHRMEQEERMRLEQSKAIKLSNDVQAWVQARRTRAYVVELQKLKTAVTGIEGWIAWAKRRADAIDRECNLFCV